MVKIAKKAAFDAKVFLTTPSRGRTISKYRKDEVIYSQAEPADAVFYIKKGKVKIVVASKEGKEAVIAILGKDEFFGEGCLNAQSQRLATARAMTESAVLRVEKAEMIRVLHDEPTFAELFMSHLLTRNSRIEEDLVDQLFNSSEKRLARIQGDSVKSEVIGRTGARPCSCRPGSVRWLGLERARRISGF
jgi:CRP/FNR family cyclic AMP-dependent transcriptional regulator